MNLSPEQLCIITEEINKAYGSDIGQEVAVRMLQHPGTIDKPLHWARFHAKRLNKREQYRHKRLVQGSSSAHYNFYVYGVDVHD